MDGSSPCREVASIDEVEEVEVDIASLRHTERRGASLLTAIAVLIISLFEYPAAQNAKQAVVRERRAKRRRRSCSSSSGLFISPTIKKGVHACMLIVKVQKTLAVGFLQSSK